MECHVLLLVAGVVSVGGVEMFGRSLANGYSEESALLISIHSSFNIERLFHFEISSLVAREIPIKFTETGPPLDML